MWKKVGGYVGFSLVNKKFTKIRFEKQGVNTVISGNQQK
jgi:hypothetical protein